MHVCICVCMHIHVCTYMCACVSVQGTARRDYLGHFMADRRLAGAQRRFWEPNMSLQEQQVLLAVRQLSSPF